MKKAPLFSDHPQSAERTHARMWHVGRIGRAGHVRRTGAGIMIAAGSIMIAGIAGAVIAMPAHAQEGTLSRETTAYAPMKPFEKLAGKVLRGEGTGPDGAPIVDIGKGEFILGGRAFQSTHRLESGTYGGTTIFFYDEGAEAYIFHYFTTAGFHTTGTVDLTDDGFAAVEQVIGHDTFAEVRSVMTIDGDTATVSSVHVKKNGETSQGDGMVYRVVDRPGPQFDDIAASDTQQDGDL